MVETPDSTKPTISVVVLNLGTGDIIMNVSETVDQTPSTNVIFKSFVIRNDSSTSSTQIINISDGGGTYSPYNQYTNIYNDSASIVFKLTETNDQLCYGGLVIKVVMASRPCCMCNQRPF